MSGRRAPAHVQVYVAACSGSARLSADIGLPLVHVGVALDAAHAVRSLNAAAHASGVRIDDVQPLGHDRGWDDWALFDYAPGPWRVGMGTRPLDVRAVEGRLEVSLPAGATIAEFRAELSAALRHLRLHEVTSAMAVGEARRGAPPDRIVHPRYTWNPRDGGDREARRVDDIYVLDPAERPWSLFWSVVAARLAAVGGAP